MATSRRTLRYALLGAAAFVALIVLAFIILTRTDFGVERAGQFAVERLRSSVHGELRVGGVTSRGLLSGVTIHDVTIEDPEGRLFLAADSARLAYRIRTLLGGDIAFDRLTLYTPTVNLERLPGQEEWNFERIFPGDTTTVPDTLPDEDLVLIEDVTVMDGTVVLRLPWDPEPPVEPEDTARLILEDVPGGVARVMRFEAVNGRMPRIVWDAPGDDPKLFQIAELSTRAYIWDTPADIRQLQGTMAWQDSVLLFETPSVRLPDSELSAVGELVLGEEERFDIEARGDDVAFADFQWLYPALPDDGGGALTFRMQTQGDGRTLWLVQDARLRTGGTELAGSFGVITGDTLYFTNVSLRASPLDLELLEAVIPGDLPLEGLLIGTVEVEGPVSSLRTRGDVRFNRLAGIEGESAARWNGTVRAAPPYGASGLKAELTRVDLSQLAAWVPQVRLQGIASGNVEVDGHLDGDLLVGGELHIDGGAGLSSVRGVGHFDQVDGARRMDVRFDAEPVVLALLTEQFPELGPLMGSATGPVTLAGGLDDLRVHADLATPAGSVVLDGRLALDGERPRYRAEGSVTSFEIHRVLTGIPDARLTARFELDGTGLEPATMDSRVNLNIFDAEVDGIRVDGGFVRAAAAHGRASLDTLSLTTAAGTITGRGTFGLASAIEGTLRFRAVADSLGALEPLLPPTALDTGFVGPRLAGEGTVDGVLTGSLERWSLGGDIALSGAALDHNSARRLAVRVDWAPGERQVTVVGRVDTLRSGHRELPGVQVRGRYARGAGELVLHATGPDDERLMLDGAFARTATGARYTLTGLTLDTNDGTWTLADSAVGDVGRAGIEVRSLVLERAADDARIAAAGVLPWSGSATAADDSAAAGFSASVRNLRIGELLRLAQSDTVMDGLVQGRFTVSGTAADPVMNASVSATGFRYGEATLDSVVAEVGYGDLQARGRISGWREGADIIGGEGYVPVDLALAERAERRLPHPMELRLRADSVPAGLVGFLAPGFRQVAGVLDGDFVVGGTPVDPAFRGELRLSRGAAYFDHSGVQYRDINAVATMRETLMALEGRLRTENGTGEVRGVLDLSEPTDPGFDLRVTAQGLDASRRRDVVAVAEGSAHLTGRYSRPVVSGQVRFTSGEMNLAEIRRQYEIVQLDPWFFEEVDASASVRPEEQNPFLANLRVTDATIALDRNFWLRGPQLNVEIAGELNVEYSRQNRDLRLTGPLEAVRGSYELQVVQGLPGRRFDIREGTIDFVGTPGIDPELNIAAQYRLRRSQGDPIDVVARLAGSLQAPRVTLTSESDLPISESDLASYIIFGRASSELTQMESDVVSGQFGQLRQGLVGFALPTVYGLGSSVLQSVLTLQSVFSLDHVALTSVQQEYTDLSAMDLLSDAQVELGGYAPAPFQDLFLVTSMRFPGGQADAGTRLGVPRFGIRAEWRFRPTWTAEGFVEDRFARTPSFGLGEIEDRTVYGLSLFREWGY